jgi:hypothetical protein
MEGARQLPQSQQFLVERVVGLVKKAEKAQKAEEAMQLVLPQ